MFCIESLSLKSLGGVVIKGFGRGSKELGCPTANISIEPYRAVLEEIPLGVYWGVASVAGPKQEHVYGMALNVGWSPFYQNKEKTIEIHVLHEFGEDFYGHEIRAIAMGYIRPEANFNGLDELKKAIADDIEYARNKLDTPEAKAAVLDPYVKWKTNE